MRDSLSCSGSIGPPICGTEVIRSLRQRDVYPMGGINTLISSCPQHHFPPLKILTTASPASLIEQRKAGRQKQNRNRPERILFNLPRYSPWFLRSTKLYNITIQVASGRAGVKSQMLQRNHPNSQSQTSPEFSVNFTKYNSMCPMSMQRLCCKQ